MFKLGDDLRPRPDLAARWPTEADIDFDPFSVAVQLRDAKWSDGKPISAEDVRFSLERLRSGPTGYRYRYLRAVDVLDPRSFRLRFDRVVRRWWSLFSLDDMILPAHAYSEQWDSRGPTVSGGPFVLEKWTQGFQVTLRRNESYWGAKPILRGIDVVFVPDEETRFQLMQLGEIDAFFAPGEVNVGRRASARGLEPTSRPLQGDGEASNRWSGAWWELDIDAGEIGTNVARAVIEAVDPVLTDEIFEDSGRPMNSIPSSFVDESDQVQPWAARGDLAEARSLLGTGGRRSFQLAFPRLSGGGAIAKFIHFRLRELGITAELVALEPDSFEKTWLPERRTAAVLRLRRAADAVDASVYANVAAQVGAAPIDEAVTAAESTVATEAIEDGPVTGLDDASWLAAQQGLVGAATVAPLVRTRTWIVGDDGVIGPVPGDALSGPFWNAATWRLEATN